MSEPGVGPPLPGDRSGHRGPSAGGDDPGPGLSRPLLVAVLVAIGAGALDLATTLVPFAPSGDRFTVGYPLASGPWPGWIQALLPGMLLMASVVWIRWPRLCAGWLMGAVLAQITIDGLLTLSIVQWFLDPELVPWLAARVVVTVAVLAVVFLARAELPPTVPGSGNLPVVLAIVGSVLYLILVLYGPLDLRDIPRFGCFLLQVEVAIAAAVLAETLPERRAAALAIAVHGVAGAVFWSAELVVRLAYVPMWSEGLQVAYGGGGNTYAVALATLAFAVVAAAAVPSINRPRRP